jgi:hypothetical protein
MCWETASGVLRCIDTLSMIAGKRLASRSPSTGPVTAATETALSTDQEAPPDSGAFSLRDASGPSLIVPAVPVASWPGLLLTRSKFSLPGLPALLLLFLSAVKLAVRQGDVELIHVDPVLLGLRFQLADRLNFMDLPPDGILKRSALPRFQPPERLVPAIQRKALTLMAALQRLAFDAMALRRIELGITPQRSDDRSQARHPVEQCKDRPRRPGEGFVRLGFVSRMQRHALGPVHGRQLLRSSVELAPPGGLQRGQLRRALAHAAIDPLVDPRFRGGFPLPDRVLRLVDPPDLRLDGCELLPELARPDAIDLPWVSNRSELRPPFRVQERPL